MNQTTNNNQLLKPGDEIVLATSNKGKISEFKPVLERAKLIVRTIDEFGDFDPEETADTFKGNARIKAEAATKLTGLPCLADDSGFCIQALEGRPGIYSSRFMKECGSEEATFNKLQEMLIDIDKENSPACFVAALCLSFPDGKVWECEEACTGNFTYPPRGDQGHGYDPVFTPSESELTFGEMFIVEKNTMSHRGKVIRTFLKGCLGITMPSISSKG